MPGRFYYLFGEPISTSGKESVVTDKNAANDLYLEVRSDVERIIRYLLKKREEDVYRSVVARSLYKAVWGSNCQIPTFEP